jgi:hypothetical protein
LTEQVPTTQLNRGNSFVDGQSKGDKISGAVAQAIAAAPFKASIAVSVQPAAPASAAAPVGEALAVVVELLGAVVVEEAGAGDGAGKRAGKMVSGFGFQGKGCRVSGERFQVSGVRFQ